MLRFLSILILGHSPAQWQACGLVASSGEIHCMVPQDRRGAELKATAFNAIGAGQIVAWAQKVQHQPKDTPAPPPMSIQDFMRQLQVEPDDAPPPTSQPKHGKVI